MDELLNDAIEKLQGGATCPHCLDGLEADAVLDALAELAAVRAKAESLWEALELCVETLALAECPGFADPAITAVVDELGEDVGYGNLMYSASVLWRKSLEAQGLGGGGEFVAGPCRVTVQNALTQGRTALAQSVKKV